MIFTTMFCFTRNFLKLSRKFIPLFADLQLSDEVCREAFWRRFSPHPRHSHYSRHNHHVMLMTIMKILIITIILTMMMIIMFVTIIITLIIIIILGYQY